VLWNKMNAKIIHIVSNEKFIPSFIEFVNGNFNINEHLFLNVCNINLEQFPLPAKKNVVEFELNLNATKNFFHLRKEIADYLKQADKIIVHGVLSGSFNKYLYFNPSFLSKAYWVMWGGDLYQPLIKPAKSFKQKFHQFFEWKIKSKFKGYITYLPGDYALAHELYGAIGVYHECILYPSNLYKHIEFPVTNGQVKTILIGNSADPTNCHIEVLEKLSLYKKQDFNIVCPLSYGDKDYANKVSQFGIAIFGERFKALKEFMKLDEYIDILSTVDIAILAHKRQQAMGNIISLLGLGKKVYLRKNITTFSLFSDLGVEVYDLEYIKLERITAEKKIDNINIIKSYFSEPNLLQQWQDIFES